MKTLAISFFVALLGFNAVAQTKKAPVKKTVPTNKPAAKPSFKNTLDSASYAFGLSMAYKLQSGGITTLNYDNFSKGLQDAFSKANPALTPEKCEEAINKLFVGLNRKKESEEIKKHQPTVKAGEAFMAANKAKPGVKTTPTGLQYEVLVQGTGKKPLDRDEVTVHYKGTLIDGTAFDSSYDRGEPATFGLRQVIAGWTEGLQLMQEGSKFRFVIPYQLGYGANGTPDGKIPPFSTLVFEVELIKIN